MKERNYIYIYFIVAEKPRSDENQEDESHENNISNLNLFSVTDGKPPSEAARTA